MSWMTVAAVFAGVFLVAAFTPALIASLPRRRIERDLDAR